MNRRILATLAAAALLLAGCSGGEKAEIHVEGGFAETGLMDMLAEEFAAETESKYEITPVTAEEIQAAMDSGDTAPCIVTDGGETLAAYINDNGLIGGEFCFDSLMLIAPVADRAGVSQLKNVTGADVLKHIALTQSKFVHAPADSQLGMMEARLWEQAGITPEGEWYIAAASEGIAVLDEAQRQEAYALVDRRSIAMVASEYVNLKVVHSNLKGMASSYFVFTAPPEEGKDDSPTQAFVRWLFSDRAKELISAYDSVGGQPAFLPGNAETGQPTVPETPTEVPVETTPPPSTPPAETTGQPENTGESVPETSAPADTGTPETSPPASEEPED